MPVSTLHRYGYFYTTARDKPPKKTRCLLRDDMINLIKKIAIYLLILFGIAYGYHYLTGRSIVTLPREIVDKLQDKSPSTESTNPKYYRKPNEDLLKN
jgi:hypothetical protein